MPEFDPSQTNFSNVPTHAGMVQNWKGGINPNMASGPDPSLVAQLGPPPERDVLQEALDRRESAAEDSKAIAQLVEQARRGGLLLNEDEARLQLMSLRSRPSHVLPTAQSRSQAQARSQLSKSLTSPPTTARSTHHPIQDLLPTQAPDRPKAKPRKPRSASSAKTLSGTLLPQPPSVGASAMPPIAMPPTLMPLTPTFSTQAPDDEISDEAVDAFFDGLLDTSGPEHLKSPEAHAAVSQEAVRISEYLAGKNVFIIFRYALVRCGLAPWSRWSLDSRKFTEKRFYDRVCNPAYIQPLLTHINTMSAAYSMKRKALMIAVWLGFRASLDYTES